MRRGPEALREAGLALATCGVNRVDCLQGPWTGPGPEALRAISPARSPTRTRSWRRWRPCAPSLWDVADEPTNRLIPDFYRAWLGGASKARALRTAQLRLLADLRAGRVRVETVAGPVVIPEQPIFWAGFALFGEPD